MVIAQTRVLWIITAIIALMFVASSADYASAGKWQRKSQEHHDQCNAWCAANPDICDHCDTIRGCRSGFDAIKSWTGYGKNYHACRKRVSRSERSAQNKADCEAYCETNPDCVGCKKKCGSGYRTIKKWAGRGNNWRACAKRNYRDPASNWNRDECHRWCDENQPLCFKCDTNKHCGPERVAIRSWKGKGRNYHACAWRTDVKAKNKADCLAWCAEHPDTCIKCKPNKNCGSGLSNLRTFKIGDNSLLDYHACKKRQGGGATLGSTE